MRNQRPHNRRAPVRPGGSSHPLRRCGFPATRGAGSPTQRSRPITAAGSDLLTIFSHHRLRRFLQLPRPRRSSWLLHRETRRIRGFFGRGETRPRERIAVFTSVWVARRPPPRGGLWRGTDKAQPTTGFFSTIPRAERGQAQVRLTNRRNPSPARGGHPPHAGWKPAPKHVSSKNWGEKKPHQTKTQDMENEGEKRLKKGRRLAKSKNGNMTRTKKQQLSGGKKKTTGAPRKSGCKRHGHGRGGRPTAAGRVPQAEVGRAFGELTFGRPALPCPRKI